MQASIEIAVGWDVCPQADRQRLRGGVALQISLVYDTTVATNPVTELKVKYFDTIPPCAAMCILKTGFLFAASESSDHGFYEFLALGDDDAQDEASSLTLEETSDGFQPVFFDPHPLKNLQLVDTMLSLAPMTDMKVANLFHAVRFPWPTPDVTKQVL